MATHSSILALENSIDRGLWQATVHGVAKLDMTERLSTHARVLSHTHTHTHTPPHPTHMLVLELQY